MTLTLERPVHDGVPVKTTGALAIDVILARDLPQGWDEAWATLPVTENHEGFLPATYMSTPITTGLELITARAAALAAGHPLDAATVDVLRRRVIDANTARAVPLREKVLAEFGYPLIDPTPLTVPDWKQEDYLKFWSTVIRDSVNAVVFADGWQYSTGCVLEFTVARTHDLARMNADFADITDFTAAELITDAISELRAAGLDTAVHEAALSVLAADFAATTTASRHLLKDERLANLSRAHNVASFASFSPELKLRAWITPTANGYHFDDERTVDIASVVQDLFDNASYGTVNVRTFIDGSSKSTPFIYGLKTVEEVMEHLRVFAAEGMYTIVNETIDINDGGVSGVSLGGVIEFGADGTPRLVEEGDAAALPVAVARQVLSTVYGPGIDIPALNGHRFEFSVHPQRVGCRQSHVLLWEWQPVEDITLNATITWPNRFSRIVGDKVYGLLVASMYGALVPRSRVIARRVAPFEFGTATGTGETWLRTAPGQQTPGEFTTTSRWVDPFTLLANEDPDKVLASVIAQDGAPATFSGASAVTSDGEVYVEGVAGFGDKFMLGKDAPITLPTHVVDAVKDAIGTLWATLGQVRVEWAYDGHRVWILQLHVTNAQIAEGVLCPGEADAWLTFNVADGIEALRALIEIARTQQAGILVDGQVGLTSHIGDILRQASIPARLA